jgi:hypothetical protein
MTRERGPGCNAILAWFLGATAFAGLANAQGAGNATLRGTVADASGAFIPGATVTVVNERTKAVRTAQTDARGEYAFAALTPGPYRAGVEMPGFARFQSDDFHLSPGDTVHLSAVMVLERRAEEVTVGAEGAILRTDTGAREGTITADQIQKLSIIGRSALELLRLLPGVTKLQEDYQTVGFVSGANNLSTTSVNGTRGTNVNPVVDGSQVIDVGCNCGSMININPDMVDEVKVQASNYAAEYGDSSVQITAVTKGGSSSFHGSVYDYARNWRLDANDRSNTIAGIPRPKSNYQYPGFNLSGPVLVPGTGFNKKRDKLFFFLGFEYQHQVLDPGTSLGVVPTLKQREGDFSEFLDGPGQNLAQPSVVQIPAGFAGEGEPAPGNDLGPYADPYGRALLHMYPLPNYADPENRYNYAFNAAEPLDRWQLMNRIDWNASEATHAYIRLALEHETQDWARGVWGGWSTFALPTPVVAENESASLSLNVTSVLGPKLTNEVIFTGTRLKLDNDWKDPSKMRLAAWGLDGLKLPFSNASQDASPIVTTNGQPLGAFVATGNLPIFAHTDSISVADTLTKVTNLHALKLGVRAERARKQQNFDAQTFGSIGLDSINTPGSTGNDYGDLLVGRLGGYYQETPTPRGEWRFWNLEGFLQDAWKARRGLTVEAGLRVAKLWNNEELNGLGMLFDPSLYDRTQGTFIDGDPDRPNGVRLARRGEIPLGMTPSPGVAFMPRLNVAWDVRRRGDLVVRGGVGLFYNRPVGNFQYFVQNAPPNRLNTSIGARDVEGGLTFANLTDLDPYSRLAATSVDSLNAGSIHLPRTWNWSAGISKRLPWRQNLEVAYAGNRADHLPDRTLTNYISPGSLTGSIAGADLDNPLHRAALDDAVAAGFRPYPAYSQANSWYEYEAVSNYHSLQVTIGRWDGRLGYFVNYTFSKALGTQGPGDSAVIDPLDPRNRSYGLTLWDRTHVFNASWNARVPDPIAAGHHRAFRALLNGWELSGITSYASGTPTRIGFSGDLVDDLGVQRAWWGTDAHQPGFANVGSVAPVFLGDPALPGHAVGDRVLDVDKIQIPAFGESGPFQPPYYVRPPTRWNVDLSAFKNFGLGGPRRLQLRVGFFNLFNQAEPLFWAGDGDFDLRTVCNVRVDGVPNGAAGTADNVCDPTQGFHFTDLTKQNFGKIVSKRGHRVIEVAVRFDF